MHEPGAGVLKDVGDRRFLEQVAKPLLGFAELPLHPQPQQLGRRAGGKNLE